MSRYLKGSRTAAVDVLTWFLLVTSTLSVLIRLGTKIWIFRKLKRDDYFSILSLVSIVVQTVGKGSQSSPGVLCRTVNLHVYGDGQWLRSASGPLDWRADGRHNEGELQLP